MKKLYLGGKRGSIIGNFALVDDDVYEWASKLKWHVTFYGYVGMRKGPNRFNVELLHRLIMGTPKGKVTDHRDGNRLNNLRENLRICTNKQNNYNRSKQSNNTTGFKGVCKDKKRNKFIASINGDFIGYFNTAKAASVAYETKAKELHGKFAFSSSRGVSIT